MDSVDSVDMSFTYQPGEYARALRRVQARKLRVVWDVLAAGVALAVGAALWATVGFTLWVGLLLGSSVFLLSMLGLGVLVMPTLMERMQPKLREPYRLSFSETGICFRTTGIDSQLSWSLYTSWWDDPDYLYLFHGKRDVTVLPRRALAGAEDDAALRALAMRHVGPAATPRP